MTLLSRANTLTTASAFLGLATFSSVASAGPLVDWLLNNRMGILRSQLLRIIH